MTVWAAETCRHVLDNNKIVLNNIVVYWRKYLYILLLCHTTGWHSLRVILHSHCHHCCCCVRYKLRPKHIGVWTVHHTSHMDRSQVSSCDIWGRPVPRELFFTEYFGFALSVSLHQCSILTFIYPLLLSGQTGETWKPSKKKWSFGNWKHWIEKCYYFCVRTSKNVPRELHDEAG